MKKTNFLSFHHRGRKELSTCTWIHQKTHWNSKRNGIISTSISKMKPLPKVITVLHQIHWTHPFQALKIPFSTVRPHWNILIQTCLGKQNDIVKLNIPNWLREENWSNLVRLDSYHALYTYIMFDSVTWILQYQIVAEQITNRKTPVTRPMAFR